VGVDTAGRLEEQAVQRIPNQYNVSVSYFSFARSEMGESTKREKKHISIQTIGVFERSKPKLFSIQQSSPLWIQTPHILLSDSIASIQQNTSVNITCTTTTHTKVEKSKQHIHHGT